MENKPKLYVSLPISNVPMDTVRKRCREARNKYAQRGYFVVTPIDIVLDQATPYSACMGKCVEALLECNAAVFLKGYGKSRGCTTEHCICEIYGITTLYDYHL